MVEHPVSIQFFIKLITAEPLENEMAKAWYKCVCAFAPSGTVSTVQSVDENGLTRTVWMVMREMDGQNEYVVPLTRDLTMGEAERIITDFNLLAPELEWEVEASTTTVQDLGTKAEVNVERDRFLDLCTAWAKRQHEDWVRERTDSGWRYGPTVSVIDKTHPLLRPWSELPDRYKNIDTDKPQMLLDLLNDQGYTVVTKGEIESMLKLIRSFGGI